MKTVLYHNTGTAGQDFSTMTVKDHVYRTGLFTIEVRKNTGKYGPVEEYAGIALDAVQASRLLGQLLEKWPNLTPYRPNYRWEE